MITLKCSVPVGMISRISETHNIRQEYPSNISIPIMKNIRSLGWKWFHDHIKAYSVSLAECFHRSISLRWFMFKISADCEFKCPELDACVNASVWCDGKSHCPSGYDESFTHCSALLRLPAEVLATLCVILLLCCFGFVTYAYRWVNWLVKWNFGLRKNKFPISRYRKIRRKFRGTSILQTRLKSLSSMDTATFDEKDVICWQSDNSVRYVEVDRVTTVWPHIAQNCVSPKNFRSTFLCIELLYVDRISVRLFISF